MARRPNRNRSKTLSLRMNPHMRYGLECTANMLGGSMTEVIERALLQMMGAIELDRPFLLASSEEDGDKVSLVDVVALTWHEDELVRLLRLGLIAPQLLAEPDRHIFGIFVGATPYGRNIGFGLEQPSFSGNDDVLQGVQGLIPNYQEHVPTFDLEECREHLPGLQESIPGLFAEPAIKPELWGSFQVKGTHKIPDTLTQLDHERPSKRTYTEPKRKK